MNEDDPACEILAIVDDLLDGAAVQSADDRSDLLGLPRILRYAVLGASERSGTYRQLAAEIVEIVPDLDNACRNWMHDPTLDRTIALGKSLDEHSVRKEDPVLRSLADSVRVVALPLPMPNQRGSVDYVRVARVLQSARDVCGKIAPQTQARIDRALLAWAAAPLLAGPDQRQKRLPAIVAGARLLEDMLSSITVAEQKSSPSGATQSASERLAMGGLPDEACPGDHVVVCRREIVGPITSRNNENLRPYVSVLNAAIPLVKCPDLRGVRNALIREFPYAQEVVDFILSGLMGRPWASFEPILIIGEPGCGKSRFVRRIGETLGVGLWRIDGTQADGSAIGGTDKRWSTSYPCGPFLAIARHQHANPLVLVDEVDKVATRGDYGNLWNSLIALCERENTRRYPDPCLAAEVDISHVSFVATANATAGLPAPLLDRFRQVVFPAPRAQDLEVLAESLRTEAARDRQIDPRLLPALTPAEREMIRPHWTGGSIRHLRRLLDVIWRSRDRTNLRH